LRKLQLTSGGEKSTDGGETTTVGGETSSKWAKRPGGETSWGQNILVAKRPVGEKLGELWVLGEKRPGGEMSRGQNIQ